MTIPSAFNSEGCLPPEDFPATLLEIRQSILVTGEGVQSPHWDKAWRAKCTDNLEILAQQLWQIGVARIFVDGSFVEEKDHPNDIDGYFECERSEFLNGQLEAKLNRLDPHKIWTWDPHQRRPFKGYPKAQLPMWHQYRVELYPYWGQPSGIKGPAGNSLNFAQAFRNSRTDNCPKGIIELVR